jgi:hypothetical protein
MPEMGHADVYMPVTVSLTVQMAMCPRIVLLSMGQWSAGSPEAKVPGGVLGLVGITFRGIANLGGVDACGFVNFWYANLWKCFFIM